MSSEAASTADPGAALKKALGKGPTGTGTKRWFWIIALLLAVAVAIGVVYYIRANAEPEGPSYETVEATTGKLVVTVSATGNLQPTNQVQVGSELSGIVQEVFVDDNDRVKKGQVLARLDILRLQDAVTRSRATLAAAEAQVLQAAATVAETKATLSRFEQVAKLSGGKVPSKAEMDTARANVKRAIANQANAAAAITQAKATLASDLTNLERANIRSPIDGVVLSRTVEPGQTVASSFQAPVLFTIAEDLAQMELQVDVDEADVGQVKVGQSATFTVDAWPGRQYTAVIIRVGFGSLVKDGVVSYPAVLQVANDDLSLRPGMTGTAEIVTLTRENALLVPDAALRFVPPDAQPKKKPRDSGGGLVGKLMPRAPRTSASSRPTKREGPPRVWVQGKDGLAVPVEVQVGASNGQLTEIVGGEIGPGTEVIVGILSETS